MTRRQERVDQLRELIAKISRDRVSLLASAITFNALITVVPLVLLIVAGLGWAIKRYPVFRNQLVESLDRALPVGEAKLQQAFSTLVADSSLIGSIGIIGLIWASTRLYTTLRQVLEIVYEQPQSDRFGYVRGKLHDGSLILLSGTLLLTSMVVTAIPQIVGKMGVELLGLHPQDLSWMVTALSWLAGLVVTVATFYLVYRFAPAIRTPRQEALLSAVIAGVAFEIAKPVFILYLSEFSRMTELYGSFKRLVVLALWCYYSSFVFVVGAQFAIVRRQRSIRA